MAANKLRIFPGKAEATRLFAMFMYDWSAVKHFCTASINLVREIQRVKLVQKI